MKRFLILLTVLTLALTVVLVSAIYLGWSGFFATTYETADPADYLQIEGNHNNGSPERFVKTFFPEELENTFQDVRYHYKAVKFDTSACEVWLEFTLDSDAAFTGFLSEYDRRFSAVPFRDGWMEYPVSPDLWILMTGDGPNWEYAQMGKILFRESDRRIIFWALYVSDGGGTEVSELNRFFTTFGVDPMELATEVFN